MAFSDFFTKAFPIDGGRWGWMDGYSLLYRCEDESKMNQKICGTHF